MFALRDAIYLIELGFYAPIIPAVISIIIIHGNKKPHTWRPIIMPLLLLASLRIAGASIGLTTLNPDKASLTTTSVLLDTIGLAPILCLVVGLLLRANAPLYEGTPFWAFIALQVTAISAAIMTACGGRDLYTSKHNERRDVRLMRAGIVIFIMVFTVAVVLAVVTMTKVRGYKAERKATIVALLSVPFMFVRLSYSAGSLFSGPDSVLNPIASDDTSVWLHLFMVVIMEYVVTLSSTAVALTAKRMSPVETEVDEMMGNDIEKKRSETSGVPSTPSGAPSTPLVSDSDDTIVCTKA